MCFATVPSPEVVLSLLQKVQRHVLGGQPACIVYNDAVKLAEHMETLDDGWQHCVEQ